MHFFVTPAAAGDFVQTYLVPAGQRLVPKMHPAC
jgi:hypothetical protein